MRNKDVKTESKKQCTASILSLSVSILAIYYLWKGAEYLLIRIAPMLGGI